MKNFLDLLGGIAALVAISIAVIWFTVGNLGPGFRYSFSASRAPTRSDACFMSQKFVTQTLKAPSTAKYPDWTGPRGLPNCKATQIGDRWKVRSYVDAQNSFGAMIRSDYGVEMRYSSERDTWTLLDIMVVNP